MKANWNPHITHRCMCHTHQHSAVSEMSSTAEVNSIFIGNLRPLLLEIHNRQEYDIFHLKLNHIVLWDIF